MALATLLTGALGGEDVYEDYGDVGFDNVWFSSGSSSIPANSMSTGASSGVDWSSVLAKGVSRVFDIAGNIAQAQNVPYYQTQAGQQAVAAANNQKTLFLILAGAVVLMMIKRG